MRDVKIAAAAGLLLEVLLYAASFSAAAFRAAEEHFWLHMTQLAGVLISERIFRSWAGLSASRNWKYDVLLGSVIVCVVLIQSVIFSGLGLAAFYVVRIVKAEKISSST
jgi:hypothetical protein